VNDISKIAGRRALDLRLSRDAAEYERIFRHPSVVADVLQPGDEPVDLAPILDNPANVGFLFDGCCFLADSVEPHIYELRSAALPEADFEYTLAAAITVIRWMFFASPALELLTRVVHGNREGKELVAKLGFSHEFRREGVWKSKSGPRSIDYFALRYPDWVKQQTWLRTSGEWFHSLAGHHADDRDPVRDTYIGAAVETLLAGQSDKAVALYNRWARFAGYEPISIISHEPLTLNLGPRRLIVDDGKIEVATCQ
jgi:hypothetical protein